MAINMLLHVQNFNVGTVLNFNAFNIYFVGHHPLSRYITTTTYTNLETILIYQLVAFLGANHQDNITNYVLCDDCYNKFNEDDQVSAL